jgi:hypothetical protein
MLHFKILLGTELRADGAHKEATAALYSLI